MLPIVAFGIIALISSFAVGAPMAVDAYQGQSIMPGDALYPIERLGEDIRSNLVDDKSHWCADHAQERLEEIKTIANRIESNDRLHELLDDVYADYQDDVAALTDANDIEGLIELTRVMMQDERMKEVIAILQEIIRTSPITCLSMPAMIIDPCNLGTERPALAVCGTDQSGNRAEYANFACACKTIGVVQYTMGRCV